MVIEEAGDELPFGERPEAKGVIGAARNQGLAIRRNGEAEDLCCMSGENGGTGA